MGSLVPGGLRRYRRCASIIMVGLLALAQMAGAAVSVNAADPVTAQTAIAHTETKLGPTAVQKSITLAVSLAPLVNQQGMDDFLKQLADPKSPSYQKYLTPKEFTAKFLDPAGRAAVADFLKSKGLTVKDTGVGSVINATGTVGQVQQAFNVTLNDYKDASGQTFYANDKTPALPTAVAPRITAVLGLTNAQAAHSHIAKPTHPTPHAVTAKTATGCAGALNVVNTFGGYTPNQFGTAYDFDTLYNAGFKGEGQTLALFELSDWASTDSDTYKACFGSTTPVNRVNVDGGTADTSGAGEVNLDIDVMIGMLPKLGTLNVYVSPNSGQGVVDQYQQMATDNTASVISTSWGLCENFAGPTSGPGSVVAAENTIFFQMASQGQQIFAASGDDGSEDCFRNGSTILNTDDPASQPYMVAVGGTTANINTTTNAYVSETVWNHDGGGGGGGLSHNWALPSWQTGPGVTNGFSNGKREVPDVSAPADPNTGYVVFDTGSGGWTLIGGTSGAAPFTASGFALMNQAFVARVGHRLGFTSPYLYSILTNNPSVLHDVTVGNNCAQASGPCVTAGNVYPATANFDLATGVGTPKVGAIANYLVPPTTATTGIGIWRGGAWYLRNSVSTGSPTTAFGYGTSTDIPLMCDWFGTGHRMPGIFRNGVFYMSSSTSSPNVALAVAFGTTGDIPVCGDWTGSGKQTIGIFRNGAFYLSNSNTAPAVNFAIGFGSPGDIPVVGDWTGSGKETIGIFRNGAFYLSNSNTAPAVNFAIGFGTTGDIPVVGDWTNSGKETIGIYRGGGWYLSNSNTAPAVNFAFGYGGAAGDKPLVWK